MLNLFGDRAYTVKEIDALRKVVDNVYLFGSNYYKKNRNSFQSVNYVKHEKAKIVEERVRTYMLAGITAEDLIKEYSE